jgi:hypothetical protein
MNAVEKRVQDAVDAWNAQVPVGTPVRYWTFTRDYEGATGHTRTPAQLLSGHTPVVWVTGHGACIALTHVDPIDESDLQVLSGGAS